MQLVLGQPLPFLGKRAVDDHAAADPSGAPQFSTSDGSQDEVAVPLHGQLLPPPVGQVLTLTQREPAPALIQEEFHSVLLRDGACSLKDLNRCWPC